ncbi:MAG: ATP-dependent Clp protease adaptor ClpS [Ferruginibacter sp.]
MENKIYSTILSSPEEDTITIDEILVEEGKGFNLVIWNDDINTFDWVIETLVSVCKHTSEQAEQCALLIHLKGKCSVKNGSYNFLKPQCDAINERLINATIEEG